MRIQQIETEIAALTAETARLNHEAGWRHFARAASVILSVMAITKLLLHWH